MNAITISQKQKNKHLSFHHYEYIIRFLFIVMQYMLNIKDLGNESSIISFYSSIFNSLFMK
ncbi:hypothetical protein WKT02_07180 [Erysipelotrichaceae bacterium HCN-30851]